MTRLAFKTALVMFAILVAQDISLANEENCPTSTREKKIQLWERIIEPSGRAATDPDNCLSYAVSIYSEIKEARNSAGSNPLSDPLLNFTKSNFEKLKYAYKNKAENFSKSSFDSGFLSEAEYIVDRLMNCYPSSNPAYHSTLLTEAFKIWFEAMQTVGLDGLMHGGRFNRVLDELKPTLESYKKEHELEILDKTKTFLEQVHEKEEFWYKNRPCRGIKEPNRCANPITEEYFNTVLNKNRNNPLFKADYELYNKYSALEDKITKEKDRLIKALNSVYDPYIHPTEPKAEADNEASSASIFSSITSSVEEYTPPPSPEEIASEEKNDESKKRYAESIPPPPPEELESVNKNKESLEEAPEKPIQDNAEKVKPFGEKDIWEALGIHNLYPPDKVIESLSGVNKTEQPKIVENRQSGARSTRTNQRRRHGPLDYRSAVEAIKVIKIKNAYNSTIPSPKQDNEKGGSYKHYNDKLGETEDGYSRKPESTDDIHKMMGYPTEAKNIRAIYPNSTKKDKTTSANQYKDEETAGEIEAGSKRATRDYHYYDSRIMSFISNLQNGGTAPYGNSTWMEDLPREFFEWKMIIEILKGAEFRGSARRFNGLLALLKINIQIHTKEANLKLPTQFDLK